MIKYTILSILAIALFSCSNVTLVIKSDKKEKLKIGMPTHVTRKGKVYPLNEECKSICKDCDGLFSAWEWKTDSLKEDYLVIRIDTEFKFDTISNEEFKGRLKWEKKLYLHKVISVNKRPQYVYKIPTESEFQRINYSDMYMLTFSHKDKCYRGGPLQRMFSNPNKIRRVNMEGATTILKVK